MRDFCPVSSHGLYEHLSTLQSRYEGLNIVKLVIRESIISAVG